MAIIIISPPTLPNLEVVFMCGSFPLLHEKSDGLDLEDERAGDRDPLMNNSSSRQKQSFIVSDEVAHIEERARRMGDLEVEMFDH